MDNSKFDQLARRLSRRGALGAVTAGVLGGVLGIGAAREAQAAFPRDCRYFAISGGEGIRDRFIYDDDMTITLIKENGDRVSILRDNDGMIGKNGHSVARKTFEARRGDEIRVTARDRTANCRSMSPLYLHCCTTSTCSVSRENQRLTSGYAERCTSMRTWRPSVFFNEVWTIR